MGRTMMIRPVDGRRVKDPSKPFVDRHGKADFRLVDGLTEVPVNAYWLRSVACGDVEQVEDPHAPEEGIE